MNDQSKMIHNPVQSQVMNPVQVPVQMLPQSQAIINQVVSVPPSVMNQVQPQIINPVQMMNRPYKPWQPQPQGGPRMKSNFGNMKPNWSNWKGKHVTPDNQKPRKDYSRRVIVDKSNLNNNMKMNLGMNMNMPNASLGNVIGTGVGVGGCYKPPSLHELQSQNRMKARKFYSKKNFNNGNNNNGRFMPYGNRSRAPRNTSSFIIRAKKSGGIASLVSPCSVTPAVLPTPVISPSREVLGDIAKEEWGVDGYGSMKGLIRLRPTGHHEIDDEEEDEGGNGSSESDVEEHVEVERRLDHDLSRFEMIYPNSGYGGVAGGGDYANILENRVDDQDSHIMQLEEENLTLKERLFLMETELVDLRRRLQFLKRQNLVGNANEEVMENENESNNESDGGSDVRGLENNEHEVMSEYVSARGDKTEVDVEIKEVNNDNKSYEGGAGNVYMEEYVPGEVNVPNNGDAENVRNEILADNPVITNDEHSKGDKIASEDEAVVVSTVNDSMDDGNVQNENVAEKADSELGESEFQQHTVVTESEESESNDKRRLTEKSIGSGDLSYPIVPL